MRDCRQRQLAQSSRAAEVGSSCPTRSAHLQAQPLPKFVVVAEDPQEAAGGGEAGQVGGGQQLQASHERLIRERPQRAQAAPAHAAGIGIGVGIEEPQIGQHAVRVLHLTLAAPAGAAGGGWRRRLWTMTRCRFTHTRCYQSVCRHARSQPQSATEAWRSGGSGWTCSLEANLIKGNS